MGNVQPGDLDEQIYNIREDLRPGAATVSMDYDFYYKGIFSHCGVNVFHFLNSEDGWKITGIDDTRSQLNCRGKSLSDAGKILDEWHGAASRADSAAYFSLMAKDAVFIGTDSFEVWGKAEFLKFAAPYFAKGKAWDFEKISRNLHYDSARSMVWFDEVLDTWMGPCRGSGWLALEDDKLLIKQYVLSITVPNDKMQGVLETIGASRRPRK
ncbi:MAG: nuclear transport factor 2 family protein [Saprospiraceae bacterium]|nr:nuclear transport factor 2 family protein [Saprospiraceae bacterium]